MALFRRITLTFSLIVIVLPLVSSCSDLLGLGALSIRDWSPHGAQAAASDLASVWVDFSAEPDHVKAEAAWSLIEDGSKLSGQFTWSGTRMTYVPDRPLMQGKSYIMTVAASAETSAGNSLNNDFDWAFSTKTETTRPVVISCLPADGSRISPGNQAIVLTFSKPVNRLSLLEALSVSPDPGAAIEFSAQDRVVTFRPLNPWAKGSEYRIDLSTDLTDLSGNHLAAAVSQRFRCGLAGSAAEVLTVFASQKQPDESWTAIGSALVAQVPSDPAIVYNPSQKKDEGLIVSFTNPVLSTGIEGFFSVEPAWDFTVAPAAEYTNQFRLIPTHYFAWNGLYTLTIHAGVPDAQGRLSQEEKVFHLKADNTENRPPQIAEISFRTNPSASAASATSQVYTPDQPYAGPLLSISSEFPVGTDIVSYFDLYVRCADGAHIDAFSLMRAISFTATNGSAIIAPVSVSLSGFDPIPLAQSGLEVARVGVKITNTTQEGVITLVVADSFADTRGQHLASVFSQPWLK